MTARTATFAHRFGTLSRAYDVSGAPRRLTRRGVPVGPLGTPSKVYKGDATISEAVTDTRFEGSVTIDGGTLTNFEIVGPAAGSNKTLLTILDAGGTATDGRVQPQNPSVKVPYGVRLAGGSVERLDVGFVGDAYAAVRNTTKFKDCVGRDLIMSISSTAVGGYSHDDVWQIHAGFGHELIGCDMLAWYTTKYGEAGKPPVYNSAGVLVSGNPRYDGRTGRYQAMSALMVTAVGTTGLLLEDNYVEGGASAFNFGGLGAGTGATGYKVGTIRRTLFTPDQGNHAYLAMIGNPALPVALEQNRYTDGSTAILTRS